MVINLAGDKRVDVKKRFFVLDLIRGVAVVLMILAHSVYFFQSGDNSFILSLETLGNTLCFVLFLFVSGATLYVAYLREEIDQQGIYRRLWRRMLMLLISYFLLAFFVASRDFSAADTLQRIRLAFDIVLFRNLPSFTEYIPPFIAFSAVVMFWPALVAKTARSIWRTLAVAIALYFAGYLLNHLPVPGYLIPWKAFLAGSDGFFRFPLLQYAAVFVLGLHFGYQLIFLEGTRAKLIIFRNSAIISISLLIVSVLTYRFVLGDSAVFLRWPPTPAFLLIGIAAAFVLGYLLYRSRQLSRWPLLRDIILIYGQNAYALFWTHIFLLTAYQLAGGGRFSSPVLVLILFAALAVLSLAIATFLPFNFRLSLTLNKDSHEEQEDLLESQAIVQLGEEVAESGRREWGFLRRFFFIGQRGQPRQKRLVKKRHILLIVILIFAVVLPIFPSVIKEVESNIRSNKKVAWWDNNYAYRQNIIIDNKQPFTNLERGQMIRLTLDHRVLVQNYKTDQSGKDMALVYFDGTTSKEINYYVENDWNRNDTTLDVSLEKTIQSHSKNIDFYLYFGNFVAAKVTKQMKQSDATGANYKVSYDPVETYPVVASVSQKWNLVEAGKTLKLDLAAETALSLSSPIASWQIIGTTLSGTMIEVDAGKFETDVLLTGLPPDNYQAQVQISDNGNIYSSQKCGFAVSDPLYVAWTIDWEGYDVKNDYLDALLQIAADYKLPMTHFWNPRIYVAPTISSVRQDQLTGWLLDRIKKGDEAELHLHLFYDLVESAGVVARHDPNWGDNGDGYGVPLTAYTSDEITKIIDKADALFAEHGINKPDLFRAGAWFADTNVLQTLAGLGFRADSSGRTKYDFGRNKIAGPWDLAATAQPYFPSAQDQNKSSKIDAISILEIPDNGADSYWFSSADLISRFQTNYSGGVLTSLKQLTFLSHPHWLDQAEQQRVRDLLSVISKYRADQDLGPVKFVTSGQIADVFGGN